ncbi:MAG: hypothetical protein ACRDPI_08850 [Nocardioidaceae bacterium]
MTVELIAALRTGPWLQTGQQGWIALMTFGPVLLLIGFFIYSYKRHLDRQAREDRPEAPDDYSTPPR